MAKFLHHEPCPNCGSRDNLARYSDGSGYCFGCRHVESPTKFGGSIGLSRDSGTNAVRTIESITLTNEFPKEVTAWLAKYDLTIEDALKYKFKYNPERNQLVFVWYDDDFNILGYNARNFNPNSKRKYFTQGNISELLPIYENPQSDTLILVEDVVSAVKLHKVGFNTMPCLSSDVPVSKLVRLTKLFKKVAVWLDSNMLHNATKMARRLEAMGVSTTVIHTPLDPKEYPYTELKNTTKHLTTC